MISIADFHSVEFSELTEFYTAKDLSLVIFIVNSKRQFSLVDNRFPVSSEIRLSGNESPALKGYSLKELCI